MLTARKQLAVLDAEQEVFGNECEGAARAVWNAGLAQRQEAARRWRASRRTGQAKVGYVSQASELAQAKKDSELDWLKNAPAVVLQQTLMDLDKACRTHGSWRVKFRSKHRPKITFRYPAPKDTPVERLNRKWGQVFLPKFGWVRFRWTRPLGGELRNVTLKREGNRWLVVFLVDTRVEAPAKQPWTPETAVGVDVGVAQIVTTSDSECHDREFVTSGERRKVRRLEQQLARQRRTNTGWRKSRRYQQTKQRLQKLRTRQTERRSDFHHQTAAALTKNYTLICHEKLNIAGMTRSAAGTIEEPGRNVAQKAGLNRSILDKGWGQFFATLAWHAHKRGVTLQAIPAHHTSQECPECHHVAANNRESQAVFACRMCGFTEHADVVGARNVRERGIKLAPVPGHGMAARGDLEQQLVCETRTANTRTLAPTG